MRTYVYIENKPHATCVLCILIPFYIDMLCLHISLTKYNTKINNSSVYVCLYMCVYMCVYIHVCVVYVCMPAGTCMGVQDHVCACEGQRKTSVALCVSPLRSLSNPEATLKIHWLAKAPRSPLSQMPPPESLQLQAHVAMLHFYMSDRDWNSGLHTWTESILIPKVAPPDP